MVAVILSRPGMDPALRSDRSSARMEATTRGRDRSGFHAAVGGNAIFIIPLDCLWIEWRGAQSAQHLDFLLPGVVDDQWHLAADCKQAIVGDCEGEQRRSGGIRGITALFKEPNAGGDRVSFARGNRASYAGAFPCDLIIAPRVDSESQYYQQDRCDCCD